MKHKILASSDMHPYEIVEVEIIGETESEQTSIKNADEVLENYLTVRLNVIEVLENTSPVFLIKRPNRKLGLG